MGDTLAIILGASEWPRYPALETTPAFLNSAEFFSTYLSSEDGLGLNRENILWLFDDKEQPAQVIDKTVEFLKKRANNESVTDIVVYYVGHGAYVENNYVFALQCTNPNNRALTTLPIKVLAKTLFEETPNKRHLVIIDACYASGAVPDFIYQDGGEAITTIREQIREVLPEKDISRGTALFCAAGPKTPAKAPRESKYTMFSGALQRILTNGDPSVQEEFLSLEELARLVHQDILNNFRDETVRPELHTPRQEEGDIRGLRFFPNPARRVRDFRWRTFEESMQQVREQMTTQALALQSIRATIDLITKRDVSPNTVQQSRQDIRERVKFLVQNPSLPDAAVTQFLNQVLRAGVYAENTSWHIYIEEYKPELNAYRMRTLTEHHYTNMFTDQPVSVELTYGYVPDKFPSLGPDVEIGRYLQLLIGDEDRLRGRGPLIFTEEGIRERSQVHLAPSGKTVIRTEYITLMAVGEEQRIVPQRFVQLLSVEIKNQCARLVKIRIERTGVSGEERVGLSVPDYNGEVLDLFFGRTYRAPPVQGISPGEKGFSFRLLPPA